MSKYVGIKQVDAVPMAVAATPQYPSMDGHPEGTEGYEVTYPDGYVSWSPKDVFDAAYKPTTSMSFPEALYMMKQGHSVACAHWNTFFMRVEIGTVKKPLPPLEEIADGTLTEYPTAVTMLYDAPMFQLTTEELEVFQDWHPNRLDLQCSSWYVWTQEDADQAKADHDAAVAAAEAAAAEEPAP